MRIEAVRPGELAAEQLNRWAELQYQAKNLASPFYAHDFMSAVAANRNDVFVGIVFDNAKIQGFFPFHKKLGKVGAPIGGPISDYQGLIAPDDERITASALLKGCGLHAFDFNHGIKSQALFANSAHTFIDSPSLDLSAGYDAYRQAIIDSGTSELKNTERKIRKLEREIGPIRLVPQDESPGAWAKMIEWKNASYERMGVSSILNVSWVRNSLEIIRDKKSADFSGMLSSLYAGDRLAAVHFGMRSRNDWHWWFPTYGPELEKYSPGVILLLEMARWGAENGITRIDLGRGDARYKSAFSNASTTLCEGSIELAASPAGAARLVRKGLHQATARVLPKAVDFQRRAFNRFLGAGRIHS